MNKNWFLETSNTTLTALSSDPAHGLEQAEVERRLAEYGPNELVEKGNQSPWRILLEQLSDAMVVVLIVAAIISGFIGEVQDTIVGSRLSS